MPVKLIFFDTNKSYINDYKNVLNGQFSEYNIATDFLHMDLSQVEATYHPRVYISPANSFGDMRGGIDKAYHIMFPHVERAVIAEIEKAKLATYNSRYILPVGNALLVEIPQTVKWLIVAPTMTTPMNIQGTDNIYMAFVAILQHIRMFKKPIPEVVIACPCLGTGIGGLSATESAQQILSALEYAISN